MSRKPSKFRKRKREQREQRDIETRSAADIGRDMHKLLISGHFHEYKGHSKSVLDQGRLVNHQMVAYAGAAGLDEVVVITGGDLIHEPVLHTDLVPFDLAKAERVMKDYSDTLRRAMSRRYIPDPRLDHATGRIRPVFDEDSE